MLFMRHAGQQEGQACISFLQNAYRYGNHAVSVGMSLSEVVAHAQQVVSMYHGGLILLPVATQPRSSLHAKPSYCILEPIQLNLTAAQAMCGLPAHHSLIAYVTKHLEQRSICHLRRDVCCQPGLSGQLGVVWHAVCCAAPLTVAWQKCAGRRAWGCWLTALLQWAYLRYKTNKP